MVAVSGERKFIFVTCQIGAEAAVKDELARGHPDLRFSYSRPGFLTFKRPETSSVADDFWLDASFARSFGRVLGKADGSATEALAADVWRVAANEQVDRLHVWPRDIASPGHRGFEPGVDDLAVAAREAIMRAAPGGSEADLGGETLQGDRVLDCILVGPHEWWIGIHQVTRRTQCWPGGIWAGPPPDEMISRAYLKMSEALDWSNLPAKPGQRCVEIGCAPGGASQALLERGLRVTGIDPADVDPRIMQHREFRHIKQRGSDLRRREFQEFQWLVADMNIAPACTLACVRDIVTHRLVHIRGLVMNLKFAHWGLADQVPEFVAEVRGWGYRRVRARQLSFQRQEICITGVKPQSRKRRRRSAASKQQTAS
ncbi:MAG: SAM-dependent methyltransferase [Pirellulales bacterium]